MTDVLMLSIAALGTGALTEDAMQRHIFPLFSGVLANKEIYLANHSLGRPLDQTAEDIREAYTLWQRHLGNAWDAWLGEQRNYRSRIATLIDAPRVDCIVPKTSAGQGLRTVLNALPGKPRVLTTRGEFDSVDLILKQYAAIGRIELQFVDTEADGQFDLTRLMNEINHETDIVVVSQVMFMTGQIIHNLDTLAEACHRMGTRLLVDAYHAVGVFPVDVAAMGADFMIGGCYKYLRGGPGACFLYISPDALSSGLAPLDTGWFAKEDPFLYERPDPPRFAPGGNAFLESTPPIFTYYQSRSGQQFAIEIGIARLRAYVMDRLNKLKGYLAHVGISANGADADHGGFLAIKNENAAKLAEQLAIAGILADARSNWLRLSPDCLTSDAELCRTAQTLASILEKQ